MRSRGLQRPSDWKLDRLLACGFALVLLLQASACTLVRFDKRSVYKFDQPFAVGDEAFRRSLSTFGFATVGGNQAEILKNGDAILGGMTGAIREARSTVNLEFYIFKDDRAGKIMAEALMEAARRGVEVRVLVDGTGSKFAGPMLARMRQAGVKTAMFRPIRLWTLYKIARRTHRKILIVDGTVSFTGGFCIAEQWLGDARNPSEWRDTMVQVTGPVSAQMQSIFSEDWTFTTGEILAGDKFYPRLAPAGEIEAQAIKVSRRLLLARRSMHENAEASFAFYDREFGARMEAVFAEDESRSREITYESWKRRGAEQRVAEIISSLFEPLY